MRVLRDDEFDRIARTLFGPCLRGFVSEHVRRGGVVPERSRPHLVDQGVAPQGDIFDVFESIFGRGGR